MEQDKPRNQMLCSTCAEEFWQRNEDASSYRHCWWRRHLTENDCKERKSSQLAEQIYAIATDATTSIAAKLKALKNIPVARKKGAEVARYLLSEYYDSLARSKYDAYIKGFSFPIFNTEYNAYPNWNIARNACTPRGMNLRTKHDSCRRLYNYIAQNFPQSTTDYNVVIDRYYKNYRGYFRLLPELSRYSYEDKFDSSAVYLRLISIVKRHHRIWANAIEPRHMGGYINLQRTGIATFETMFDNIHYTRFKGEFLYVEKIETYDTNYSDYHHGIGNLTKTERYIVVNGERYPIKGFTPTYLLNFLRARHSIKKVKVEESLKPVQLSNYFDVKFHSHVFDGTMYTRTFDGVLYDYCYLKVAEGNAITYHAPSYKEAIDGWNRKARINKNKFIHKFGDTEIDINIAQKYGFCYTGIHSFCKLNKINPQKTYTLAEIAERVMERETENRKRYEQELKRLHIF